MAEPDSLYLSIGLPDGTERRFNLDPPRDGLLSGLSTGGHLSGGSGLLEMRSTSR